MDFFYFEMEKNPKKTFPQFSLRRNFVACFTNQPTNQAAENEYTKYDSANFALIIYQPAI